MNETTRINRYISDKGVCSRREADSLIETGKVEINGRKAVLGDKVGDADVVKVNGKALPKKRASDIVIAYYKPVGIECTTNQSVPENIIDAVGFDERVFPIGRLDKMSEGLILLTNLGEIVNKILRSENNHEKEYVVYLNNPVRDETLQRMSEGIWLEVGGEDVKTKTCEIERLKRDCIRMTLTEGKNRQIRRMLDKFDLRAKRLKRIRVLNINLGDMQPGSWRHLTAKEKTVLFSQLTAIV